MSGSGDELTVTNCLARTIWLMRASQSRNSIGVAAFTVTRPVRLVELTGACDSNEAVVTITKEDSAQRRTIGNGMTRSSGWGSKERIGANPNSQDPTPRTRAFGWELEFGCWDELLSVSRGLSPDASNARR